MKATREAYGETLVELGREHPEIVVLDADLSSSTMTSKFAKEFPERFFNFGIAEANMMGAAAGLARSGKVPFASTFAVFASGRAYDQVRQSIAYPGFNVKIAASHGGLTVGPDGASHQALEDVALMRVIPGMTVIVPADAEETRQVVRWAAAHDGPVYIRLGRSPVPDVFPQGAKIQPGKASVVKDAKGRGFGEMRPEGERDGLDADVAILANGIMVSKCLEAWEILTAEGIKSVVVDVAFVKPLDEKTLIELAERCGAFVTAEEHSVIGGLGGAVTEFLSENRPCPVVRVGVRDRFGQSGTPEELLVEYGLTPGHVAEAARKAVRLKWAV
ncbi:MAG: transketolase family protein [Firmicutes bacterium]|nr:transketolase family protein [Candidatus Fermentithermobacillaceae bacterium]